MKPSEILKAHEDGLTVEWRYNGDLGWTVLRIDGKLNLSNLSCRNTEYRIKKEPRTFWMTLRNNGEVVTAHDDKEKAYKHLKNVNGQGGLRQYQPYSIVTSTENL